MSLSSQVEAGFEVKAPAHLVHELFSSKLHLLPSVCPQKILSVDLIDGEWGKAGSVISIRYALEGKSDLGVKDILEEIDNESYKFTYKVTEGSLLELYQSFRFKCQATPKGEGSCFVTWGLKYEKPNEKVPDPTTMLQFSMDAMKVLADKLVPQPQA